MGKTTGFLEFTRKSKARRPVKERLSDWLGVDQQQSGDELGRQAARCMDCGVPFCSSGCPVNNIIPDFNDMVYHGLWREALETLQKTNNFPEFTGSICPAPCEKSCVLDIHDDPVSICQLELAIAERGFREGWIQPERPPLSTGFEIAIVGSGPAGLAAAQQLRRRGHGVTVFERYRRAGGLLTYGIPDFKLDKQMVARRISILEQEGVRFVFGVEIGNDLSPTELRSRYDAVCLACGAEQPRDLSISARELSGVHFAMPYLLQQNRRVAGEPISDEEILATNKHVIVVGGGDTASDCIGTANRQGAKSVVQIDYHDKPPLTRSDETPWPMWPKVFSTSCSQEEGVERRFNLFTRGTRATKSGTIKAIRCTAIDWYRENGHWSWREKADTVSELPCDLLLIAIGYAGPKPELISAWNLELSQLGSVRVDENMMTNQQGVFCAGDMSRGASLVVWAIRDGRDAAAGIHRYLTRHTP